MVMRIRLMMERKAVIRENPNKISELHAGQGSVYDPYP